MGNVETTCCVSRERKGLTKQELRAERTSKVKPLPGPIGMLQQTFGGRMFLPTDQGYHMARGDPDEGPLVRWDAFEAEGSFRQTWNLDCLGFPCAIVTVANVAEVGQVVKYASQHCLKEGVNLCVACGRHSHQCMLDDTLVLDLQKLNSIVVDKDKKTAKVGGGAMQGEMDMACEPFALATPAGHNASTGCGGLVLQGGHGFLERKFGLVVDNLLEAEVVLSDGRLVTASEKDDAELFWAIRGGGGNFGVVVSFTFQLHPLSTVYAGVRVHVPAWPFGKERDALLMEWYEKIVKGPNDASGLAVMPGGGPFVEMLLWTGDSAEGEAYFTEKNASWPLLKNSMGPHSYHREVQRFYEPGNDKPHYQTGVLLPEMTQEIATVLAGLVVGSCAPTDLCAIIVLPLGGQMSVPAPTATANPHRHYKCWVLISGSWLPNAGEEVRNKCIDWVRKVKKAMHPFSEGASYGVLGEVVTHDDTVPQVMTLHDEGGAVGCFIGKRNIFGDNLPRLQHAKKVYDPQNLFRINDNILPA